MNLLDQRRLINGAAAGDPKSAGALFTALVDRVFQRTSIYGIALHELRKSSAMKDILADTPGSSLLGVGDTAGSLLTGTTTNGGSTASANESASFLFALPASYIAGGAITVRSRAKVSAARNVSQTVDCVCKNAGDTLGSDICATAAQTLTTGYVNYDFTITPTGLSAGMLLNVDLYLATDDTGAAANGLPTITHIEMRCDTSP